MTLYYAPPHTLRRLLPLRSTSFRRGKNTLASSVFLIPPCFSVPFLRGLCVTLLSPSLPIGPCNLTATSTLHPEPWSALERPLNSLSVCVSHPLTIWNRAEGLRYFHLRNMFASQPRMSFIIFDVVVFPFAMPVAPLSHFSTTFLRRFRTAFFPSFTKIASVHGFSPNSLRIRQGIVHLVFVGNLSPSM